MKKRVYRVCNIEYGNFCFTKEEMDKFEAELIFSNFNAASYLILATWLQAMQLRIRFMFERIFNNYEVIIKRAKWKGQYWPSRFISNIQKKRR